jgi:hypothetical protein
VQYTGLSHGSTLSLSLFGLAVLPRWRPTCNARTTEREVAMYHKHLEQVELRENAMAARVGAASARWLAARSHRGSAAAFDCHAATLEKRAAIIEDRARRLEAALNAELVEEA